jgi:hypothetical protein
MTTDHHRRWRQFSLRGLLVLVTLAALFCGWFAWRLRQGWLQDAAANEIVRAGGAVAYSNQFYSGVSRLAPFEPRSSWFGNLTNPLFGTDPFRKLVSITVHDDASAALISKYPLYDLETIRLEGSNVTDDALQHIQNCRHAKVLLVHNAPVTDQGLAKIRSLSELEELWIVGSQVTDAGLDNLVEFSELKELWLHDTAVSDAGLQKLRHLQRLSVLDLRSTQISDSGLAVVASMPAIKMLLVDQDTLTDQGLKNLRPAPKLFKLWLSTRTSSKLDLGVLSEFPLLSDLTLSGPIGTDAALQPLASNTRITRLELDWCAGLTDESLTTLAQIPNLQKVQLIRTKFSPQAISAFQTQKPYCTIR